MTTQHRRHGARTLLPWLGALIAVWAIHFPITAYVNEYVQLILLYIGINMILAVSLNLVNGFTGQFSMGHAGFMSVGGYASAYFASVFHRYSPTVFNSSMDGGSSFWSTPLFLLSLTFGGLVAMAAGYLVGKPSLRLKGDYLAIVTLGFGEIIRVVVLNTPAIGGATGMNNIPYFASFGWLYTFVIFTIFILWRLIYSRHGRGFLSVREDEIAAEAMGVDTTQAKVHAFMLGAFFAGIAGGLFAHRLTYLNPQTFDFNKSFEIIIMVVLGGMGSISGSIVAAILLTVMMEGLKELKEITKLDLRMVIYSLILIILMLTRPNGLFGRKEWFDFLPKRLRERFGSWIFQGTTPAPAEEV